MEAISAEAGQHCLPASLMMKQSPAHAGTRQAQDLSQRPSRRMADGMACIRLLHGMVFDFSAGEFA